MQRPKRPEERCDANEHYVVERSLHFIYHDDEVSDLPQGGDIVFDKDNGFAFVAQPPQKAHSLLASQVNLLLKEVTN